MKFTGMVVARPKKNVITSIKNYDTQLLSTRKALIEQRSGEFKGDLFHNRSDGLPLILGGYIDLEKKRHALVPLKIDNQKATSPNSTYYRIFLNKNKIPL